MHESIKSSKPNSQIRNSANKKANNPNPKHKEPMFCVVPIIKNFQSL